MEDARYTVKNLKDLLPEVLIEAQGCDEITALAALRRAFEKLCISHDFDEREFVFSCRVRGVAILDDCARLQLGEQNLLRVHSVKRMDKVGEKRFNLKPVPFDQFPGGVKIPAYCLQEDEGGRCYFRIRATAMPDLDGKIYNTEKVTKWRNLLTSLALKDLFAMEGQPWSSSLRLSHYVNESEMLLSTYAVDERYNGSEDTQHNVSVSPSMNVFC